MEPSGCVESIALKQRSFLERHSEHELKCRLVRMPGS